MPVCFSVLILATAIAATATAHADTIFQFVDVSFSDGATGTGTITINTVLGTVTGLSFSFKHDGSSDSFGYPLSNSSTYQNETFVVGRAIDLNRALIELPVGSLIGYTGGSLCTTSSPCFQGSYGFVSVGPADYNVETGRLVSTSTPEPSSLALLATGLLGVAGLLRQRRHTRGSGVR